MPQALKTCSTPGCPELVAAGRCTSCQQQAEQTRGTAHKRGYGRAHRAFRRAVLRRDPLCVCTDQDHGHGPQCRAPATVADHHPLSLRELQRLGLNPYHPSRGRGLCSSCHSRHTGKAQPGGWHQSGG